MMMIGIEAYYIIYRGKIRPKYYNVISCFQFHLYRHVLELELPTYLKETYHSGCD